LPNARLAIKVGARTDTKNPHIYISFEIMLITANYSPTTPKVVLAEFVKHYPVNAMQITAL